MRAELLERVLLRLALAQTDEAFEQQLTTLLVPLLSWLGFFGDTRVGLLAAFLAGIGAGYLIFRLTKSLQFKRP